jgi:hypothetical protein
MESTSAMETAYSTGEATVRTAYDTTTRIASYVPASPVTVISSIPISGVEAAAVTPVDEASAPDVIRRIEPISKRIPEQSVTRQPRVTDRTASPVPSWIKTGCAGIFLGEVDVRLP